MAISYSDFLLELKKHTPYDFMEYSHNSIHRRITKVLTDYALDLDQMVERIKTDSDFVEKIVEEITVNTTELFRDPDVWVYLYENVYPKLKNKKSINIWHAGCSSGQEVYSNMILLNELGLLDKCKIFATDLNQRVLNSAKSGKYKYRFNKKYIDNFTHVISKVSFQGDNPNPFEKYFVINEEEDTMQILSEFRKIPDFKKHDLVSVHSPFAHKFDIIFCRNVLIYFNTGLQDRIVKLFHEHTFDGGFLILGAHENLSGFFKTKYIRESFVYKRTGIFHMKF